MRRLPVSTTTLVVFGALLVLALLVLLPLRVALGASGLERNGFSARSVSGLAWSGRMRDVRFGDIDLGDLDVAVSPLELLIGRTSMRVGRPANEAALFPLAGQFSRAGDGISVDNFTGTVPANGLFDPLPVGAIEFAEFHARFAEGRCSDASGTIRVSIGTTIPGLNLSQGLAGNARCQDGVLVLPLQGQSGLETLELRVEGNGQYVATFSVGGIAPDSGAPLAAMGFAAQGDRYMMTVEGSF